jgi:hypothetical protein
VWSDGLNGRGWEPGTGSAGKVMNGVPTSVYDVQRIRNAGWPTGRESYGHGILVVVDGVTPIQEDGNAVHRAKQERQ